MIIVKKNPILFRIFISKLLGSGTSNLAHFRFLMISPHPYTVTVVPYLSLLLDLHDFLPLQTPGETYDFTKILVILIVH